MQDAGAHNTSASSAAGRSASAHLKNDGQWPIASLALPPRRTDWAVRNTAEECWQGHFINIMCDGV